MRMLNPAEFLAQTCAPLSRPPGELDVTDYLGVHYPCACGRAHQLSESVELMREMMTPEPRVILACPDLGHQALTLVQLRQGMTTRAMSEMGCRFEDDTGPLELLECEQ